MTRQKKSPGVLPPGPQSSALREPVPPDRGAVKAHRESADAGRERAVLASIFENTAAALKRPKLGWIVGNAPRSVSDPTIAAALCEIRSQGPGSTVATVIQCLEKSRQIDASGRAMLLGMLGEALPIDLAELSAGELIEHRRGPQIALALREAAEYVEGNPQGAGAVVDTALETVRQLRSEGPADNGILHTLDGRRFSIEAKPDEPETRFYIGQTPICTPGNLCAVSASVKAGKSAFVQAMLAAAITMHPDAVDTLGVRARNPLGMAMIHFDTEQSPFDHWMQTERALRRARVEKPPAWFASFCVTGLSVSEARAAIDAALERAHREHGGVYAVVIDGVGDLVLDVNDSEECNGYTAHLHAAAIRYNCSIVTVIHINPGSDNGKTRGHLGSQLERKAETNLRLEKVEEITTVWSDKNRRAPITKANGPRFTWSDEAGMHVSTDQEPVKIGRPKDYTPDELVDLLPDTGLSTSAWQSACESELGVSRRSFYRECKALAHAGRVTKSAVTGLWQPIKK